MSHRSDGGNGLDWRAATPDDLPAVTALLWAMDQAETGARFTSESDAARLFDRPDVDLAVDSWLAMSGVTAVGFGLARQVPDLRQVRCRVAVHPDHVQTVEAPVVAWAEVRAREVAKRCGWRHPTAVTWQSSNCLAGAALADRGWSVVRTYHRMVVHLAAAPEPSVTPAGVRVVTAVDEATQRQLHEVLEVALADHWEHRPRDFDTFMADEHRAQGHDPSLWYVAVVDGEPAAAVVGRQGDQGWISLVGTHPRHRGRGLARVLLLTAMAELHRRGSSQVGLFVDAANVSGALRLYESVGMRTEFQADEWRFTTG